MFLKSGLLKWLALPTLESLGRAQVSAFLHSSCRDICNENYLGEALSLKSLNIEI